MRIHTELNGKIFGKLTVIRFCGSFKGHSKWDCICECGNKVTVFGQALRQGNTKSCGCFQKERTAKKNTKHGGFGTRLYRIWLGMKARCYNKLNRAYSDYGGRNISICMEWVNDYAAFRNWALSNGYSNLLTIDRKDNDGNYTPSNCRWTTMKAQSRNRRSNHLFEFNGETKSVSEWSEIKQINKHTLLDRINKNYSSIVIFNKPQEQGRVPQILINEL